MDVRGIVRDVEIAANAQWAKTDGVIPVLVKVTVQQDNGEMAYVQTSVGNRINGVFQPARVPKPFVVRDGTGWAPAVFAGDTVNIEGNLKTRKLSQWGRWYIVVNRARLIARESNEHKEEEQVPVSVRPQLDWEHLAREFLAQ